MPEYPPHWSDDLAYSVSERAYLLYTEGRYQDALDLFQALLDLYPKNLYYMDSVAALHLALERPDVTIQLASAILRNDPSHIRARVRRCEAHSTLGMYPEAEADIQQLKKLGAHEDAQRMAMRLAASRRANRLRA
jgi:tetratricopeptide (TPR) repeat protein